MTDKAKDAEGNFKYAVAVGREQIMRIVNKLDPLSKDDIDRVREHLNEIEVRARMAIDAANRVENKP